MFYFSKTYEKEINYYPGMRGMSLGLHLLMMHVIPFFFPLVLGEFESCQHLPEFSDPSRGLRRLEDQEDRCSEHPVEYCPQSWYKTSWRNWKGENSGVTRFTKPDVEA